MGRPKGSKNKLAFDDLSSDFKDAVAQSTPEQIRNRIAEIAMDEARNQTMKASDEDLAEKKEAVKFAGEGYATNTKQNKLKIKYAMMILEDKGKA